MQLLVLLHGLLAVSGPGQLSEGGLGRGALQPGGLHRRLVGQGGAEEGTEGADGGQGGALRCQDLGPGPGLGGARLAELGEGVSGLGGEVQGGVGGGEEDGGEGLGLGGRPPVEEEVRDM